MKSFVESAVRLTVGTVKHAWWIVPAILLDPLDLLGAIDIQLALPKSMLWSGFAIGVFLAVVATYHAERTRADALSAHLQPRVAMTVLNGTDAVRSGLSRLAPNLRDRHPEGLVPTESLVLQVDNMSQAEPARHVKVEVAHATPVVPGGIDQLPHLLPWYGYDFAFEHEIPAGGHAYVRLFDVYEVERNTYALNAPTQAHFVAGLDEVAYTIRAWAADSPSVSIVLNVSGLQNPLLGVLPSVDGAQRPTQ